MRNTWHFTLPEILLQPNVDHLAAQQGLSTLTTPNIQILLNLFKAFSVYADLPFGLNPTRLRALHDQLQSLKNNPNCNINEIVRMSNKVRAIKKSYRQKKITVYQQHQPIFVTYTNEDLNHIALKILTPIEIYLFNAKNELELCKLPNQTDHIFNVFKNFIESTQEILQKQQSTIAEVMLLRLQDVELSNNIVSLTPEEFIAFHGYIKQYGSLQTKKTLEELFWIKENITSLEKILKPKKPRWPKWIFRGNYTSYCVFGDAYHQVSLSLKIKRLQSIDSNDPNSFNLVEQIHQDLTEEIQKITKYQKKLFRLFHSKTYQQLSAQLRKLNQHREQAAQLQKKIQRTIKKQNEEREKKEKKRERILKRVDQYHKESTTLNQQTLLKRIYSATTTDFSEIDALVKHYANRDTQEIWKHYLDQYRLQSFINVIFDAKNSQILLSEFLQTVNHTSLPFPATEMVHQQLMHLIKQIPTAGWTEHQHTACEVIDSYPVLSEYYSRAITYPPLADKLIQRFADEQFTEIEFPELTKPIEDLIKKLLLEKEAKATAHLIQAEIDQDHVNAAILQLNRLSLDLQTKKNKQKLVLVNETLTRTTNSQESAHQLMNRLKKLVSRKTQTAHYLEEFSELKTRSEQLPYSQKNASVKRLCSAGPNIPYILNELPNAILAFASGEIQHIAIINPLLLDILEAELISPEKKSLILHLIEAVLIDPKNTLPIKEKRRLLALKKCMDGGATSDDRTVFIDQLSLNPHRLTSTDIQTKPNPGENYENIPRII